MAEHYFDTALFGTLFCAVSLGLTQLAADLIVRFTLGHDFWTKDHGKSESKSIYLVIIHIIIISVLFGGFSCIFETYRYKMRERVGDNANSAFKRDYFGPFGRLIAALNRVEWRLSSD